MGDLPLQGVRVIDVSWIIAGPTTTRYLAMMGAEVIKVGSARRPDPSTRGNPFQAYNQSKLYAALNISKPEGVELAKQLISCSDIVVENFAAGVIERRGLGYDALCEVSPDIIMVSSSGTGHTGPDKNYVAYGSLLQHYTGWNSVSGYPDREPIKGGLWADPWVALELAIVAVAALSHRADTGRGQYIDFSMAEALSASIPSALLDFQMNGKVPEPMGNRDDRWSPHGVFHCKGTDRWVAIAVTSDEEWRALCRLMEKPDLAENPAYATAESRRAHEDQLNSIITDWTLELEDYQAMKLLQDAGIPSGPSLDIGRVFDDPQLRSGDYFTRLQTSDGKQRDLPGLPWRFEGALQPKQAAAPVLGQHNEYVYHELLGLSKPELRRLEEEQILY